MASFSSGPEYGSPSFWDRRYAASANLFDWYQDYSSLRRLLRAVIPLESCILQIGVGTSAVQADMYDDGYRDITNVDVSRVCIDALAVRDRGKTGLRYEQADCRCMTQFRDESFDFVLDKGTIDALMCGAQAKEDTKESMLEVHRVLRPTGAFLCISYGPPSYRADCFMNDAYPFSVLVYAMYKPAQNVACLEMSTSRFTGPFYLDDPEQKERLFKMRDAMDPLHWLYLCQKRTCRSVPPPAPPLQPPLVVEQGHDCLEDMQPSASPPF